MNEMIDNNTWGGKAAVQKDTVEIFISNSYYNSHHAKHFPNVVGYPDLLNWLKGGPNAPSDIKAWGLEKNSKYTFIDIKKFISNGGTLDPGTKVERRKNKQMLKQVEKEKEVEKKDKRKTRK
ncbi:hypothetical protein BDQ12DRAFT_730066 [Crucibulum laeve]|uniref:Uncharacterized protein n=1 Tax=Crucibulum laeve TaxID=68775 RepID=A0A5C3LD26_9AGAR|nr:hypothetical protein BDQ12DRAFT_730066 [Crucibulum laeve]